ncbi:helix-turn-helix transcriptional regulator [Roseateles sp.]|uniref:helix-turn-helix transcriptional regulator n=1 Tax=Roseateles sp. TaxID=1971397 RepID=UPI003D0EAD94
MSSRSSERLLGLLANGERWTAALLAQELGLSVRSVRRGLAQLQQEGCVLDSEPGRGGGVRLARRSSLPRTALSQRELITVMMGLVFSGAERGAQQALRQRVRVGAAASEAVRADWRPPRPAALAEVQQAFFAQQCLHIRYQDGTSQSSEREIEPHYLLINAPAWYLLAWDVNKQATRCFRLDRIRQARPLDRRFLRRPEVQLMSEAEQGLGPFFKPL